MLYHLASCLPLMVCLVWTVILLAEFRSLDAPRRVLTVFGVVTTVLYACHFVFFERGSAGFFLTDCIWCFCTRSDDERLSSLLADPLLAASRAWDVFLGALYSAHGL